MKYIYYPFAFVFLSIFTSLSAQNPSDALRYSFLEIGGTARTMGLGGAIGALGADFSTLSTNPAGLAAYRSSELTFTPTVIIANNTSRLINSDGVDTTVNRTKFNFNNLGLVLSSKPGGNFKTFNFGIGFNRIADFNREFSYSGKSVGSYVERFVQLATDNNGNPIVPDDLDGFEAGLANATGAIFPAEDNGVEFWASDFGARPEVEKNQRIKATGSLNEMVFSMAGNFQEKMMFGATLGVPILNYSERKTYIEEDTGGGKDGDIPTFNDFRFIEDLTTSGIGINLKLGLIYRFNQAFRLGMAVHTPTAYRMDDVFFTEMEYSYNGTNGLEERSEEVSPNGAFDYNLKTPWRVLTSAALIVQRKGFITAEVEWVNYSTSNFNFSGRGSSEADELYEREVNQNIEDDFKSALNVRLGGEYALNDYRFRLGTGFTGSPYASGSISNNYYTAGFGYRGQSFYLDLGYRLSLLEEGYIPYLMESVDDQQLVNNKFLTNKILMTLGFRF